MNRIIDINLNLKILKIKTELTHSKPMAFVNRNSFWKLDLEGKTGENVTNKDGGSFSTKNSAKNLVLRKTFHTFVFYLFAKEARAQNNLVKRVIRLRLLKMKL